MAPQPIGTKKVPVTAAQKKTAVTPVRKAPIATTKVIQPTKKPVPTPYKKNNTSAQKKPQPNPEKKPQPQQHSWLTRGIGAAASGIGNAAGAVVTAAGNGVAGAGKGAGSSIANTSRAWGDAVRMYGNSIKDMTGAAGPRATTKDNPLGLSTSGTGANTSMASRSGVTGSSARSGTASNPLGL